MKQYHDLLKHILNTGHVKEDRTGVGTISTFGYQMRFNLQEGFPLVTTKKVYWHGVVEELLWFLRGETNIKSLVEKNVHIWDAWADKDGNLGPVYGAQWRNWNDGQGYIDQIAQVIEQIKTNPNSRRLIVNSWNVGHIEQMALPPCHMFFQFYVNKGKLSCQLYQRSGDAFLGIPFNIASYALLTHMAAQVCDLDVGEFVHTFGDLHIYNSHLEQVMLQLSREPKLLPQLELNKNIKCIDDFTEQDIILKNYQYYPTIKAKVAV